VMVDDKVLFKVALKDGKFSISPKHVGPENLQVLYDDLKSFVHKWLEGRKVSK
jgi:hypothetical protein